LCSGGYLLFKLLNFCILFRIDKDFWQEVFATYNSSKIRTGLTAAGVFWGIFMLIIMMGIGKGIENGVTAEFGGAVSNGIYIWPSETSIPYKGLGINRSIIFNLDDVAEIKSKISEIDKIAPRIELRGFKVAYASKNGSYEIRGELPDVFKIQSMIPMEGRILNQLDEKEKRKNVVIGKKVKEALFEKKSALNEYILINNIPFNVVGVIEYDGQGQWMQEVEEQIFMPLSTGRATFNFANNISWFVCTIKPGFPLEQIENNIKSILSQRHLVHPEDKQAIGSFNSEKDFGRITSLFSSINIFIWFVGIMTLFAGVVSVSNVMLITVKERTREIGLRKAIGATPFSVIRMILTESIVLTTISGYAGLLIGTGLIALIDYFLKSSGAGSELFKNPEVMPFVGIGALFVLVLSGTLAGLLPAQYAVRIQPIVALRAD
jgi:putative ABC transport system permease protein